MKKLLIISLLILVFIGCGPEKFYAWQEAPKTHKCTFEQMKKVKSETIFCNENTSYYNTYCYGTAILRNCEKIKETK